MSSSLITVDRLVRGGHVAAAEGDRVAWRKISLGISSFTKSQVLAGLSEGDAAALPSEKPIQTGSRFLDGVRAAS